MFKGGTIRVVSPIREGGNRIKVDPDTGQTMYKEEFFPASAKREFERLNRSLPNHLKKKIEPVNDGDTQPQQVQQPAKQTVAPVVRKRGPKPKNHGQSS